MRFLDSIGPGDPRYNIWKYETNYMPAIIIGSVLVVVATVLIVAVLIKNKKKNNKKK